MQLLRIDFFFSANYQRQIMSSRGLIGREAFAAAIISPDNYCAKINRSLLRSQFRISDSSFLDTHFATLAAGNTVMIAARLVAADLAGYETLSGRRTVGISCRVMLLCKQTRMKKTLARCFSFS